VIPSFRRSLPLAALGVVLVATLAVGTIGRGGRQTITERVQHITSQLRCPVCEGETVAGSNALISQDIRAAVQKKIESGQSNAQITAFVIQQYPGTRLVPPARGVGLLVWLLPVVGFAAAAAGLIVAFVRRRSRGGVSVSDDDRLLVARARRREAPPS
jgi:cytochrome c-type biogenesis protein CcmH